MVFTASLDETAIKRTFGSMVLLLGPLLPLFRREYPLPSLLYLSFVVCLFLFLYLLKPRNYQLTETDVIINRLIGRITIKKCNIKAVEVINRDLLRNMYRGGAFGFFGKYYIDGMGSTEWFGTRKENIVLIWTKENKKIIVTPDEPHVFVREVAIN